MKTRLITALCSVILTAAASSCANNDEIFNSFATIPENGWNADSLAVFRPTITDAQQNFDILIQVRNDNSYAFSNLWLFIDVISPSGNVERDTLECTLARTDGKWLGSGWGSLYTQQCPYKTNTRFPTPGPYTFRLIQGMRTEQLTGLHDVGIVIRKTCKK